MATDSSYRVIMGKTVWQLFLAVFNPIFVILAGNEDIHESSEEFEVPPDRTTEGEVRCP